MIHGGAGTLEQATDENFANRYLQSITLVLEQGRQILRAGGSALQTVETCVALLENDPLYNAGRGSVLNENGDVEMDAAIMDGSNLRAGAVAGIHNIANPVKLARLVMERSKHVMLIGEGALRFADLCHLERVSNSYLITQERLAQLQNVQRDAKVILDHESHSPDDPKFGTVGAVARDINGNLAAATSTGGLVNKCLGRVGDSPILGAGVYADNCGCAVSCTGYGEDFLRTALAKTVSDYAELTGLNATQAAEKGIDYLQRKVKGRGGMIVLDASGKCASRYTTKRMIRGWIENGATAVCSF